MSDTIKGVAVQIQHWIMVPVYAFSGMLIRKVGGNVIAMEIGVFSFCIRFVVDSYIRTPTLFLVTQLLHGLGYGLFWAACVAHTKEIASEEIFVTVFTIVTGVYHGLAGFIGNMLGGLVYHEYNGRVLFMCLGALSAVWTVVLCVYHHGQRWFNINRITSRSGNQRMQLGEGIKIHPQLEVEKI